MIKNGNECRKKLYFLYLLDIFKNINMMNIKQDKIMCLN